MTNDEQQAGVQRLKIPQISLSQIEALVAKVIPHATTHSEVINPNYGSWRIEITVAKHRLAFVWGPLSGFGGIDYSKPNEDIFAHSDEIFWSFDEAEQFLRRYCHV
jgi:hypothetical protein